MKAIRNTVIVALLAATPLAFANREGAGKAQEEGCQGMQSSAAGGQERQAERHARMAAMHQGMGMGAGMGMQGGEGNGHRHGQQEAEQTPKK